MRVSIDEHDAWRVTPGATAEVLVRGAPDRRARASFVRFEPFVLPRVSLTGATAERVDTRVLEVIFALEPGSLPVRVGEQVDVFVSAAPSGRGA